MLLKVDNRERTIIPALTTACGQINGVSITTENMPLGDAGIYTDDGQELILFERKSLNDLAASIKDGRYAEQSMRLSATDTPNHNIVYIIEGSFEMYNMKRNNIHPKTLLSAIVSLNYYKGFTLLRSWNPIETVDIIMSYVAKLFKTTDRKPYYRNKNNNNKNYKNSSNHDGDNEQNDNGNENGNNNGNDNGNNNGNENGNDTDDENDNNMKYLSALKKAKKDNITIDNILAIMLCQIPNVSVASAGAITIQYPTMELLIDACKRGREAFENIRIKTSNRRISSQCISSVITFILAKNKPENT